MAKGNHITFALQLDNKPNRFGRHWVYIRVTQNRKFKHIRTSVEVASPAWFDRNI